MILAAFVFILIVLNLILIKKMATRDIQWECIRKTSSFMRKQRGIRKTFTREPMNLKNIHSFRYNGLIRKKAVGVKPHPDGKGVVLLYKKARASAKPSKNITKILLTKDGRRTTRSIGGFMKTGHYRTALTKAAQRRACQILRSQKPVKASKPKRQKKEKALK